MRNTWDHLALVLYTAGIILVCLFFAFADRQDESIPELFPVPTEKKEMPTAAAVPLITAEPSFHRPILTVTHEYAFDGMTADAVPAAEGMLKIGRASCRERV